MKRLLILITFASVLALPAMASAKVHYRTCGTGAPLVHNLTCSQGRKVASRAALQVAMESRRIRYHNFRCVGGIGPKIPGAKSNWPLTHYDYYCSRGNESLWFAFT
jgi:hypothetical protein